MSADTESNDRVIAFLDANIILEGKPVADLPWEDILREGTIRALIVPKAMEEIDAKKRDGRLGPHARAFNRLIADSVMSGNAVILKENNPRVEMELASCSRIAWDRHPDLDPNDGDSRIVAEALHVKDGATSKRLFVSHDIKPLAYARRHGLEVHLASDEWLRPVELGPKEKEIQRLKSQIADYRKDEPKFEISIDVTDMDPPTIYKVTALGNEQREALIATIKAKNLKKPNGSSDSYGLTLGIGGGRDSSYDRKYQSYIGKTVPSFVERFGEKMETLFNQRRFSVRVSNVGQIRADHLVVSIKTSDGWINERIVAVSPSGPAPPVPVPDYMSHLNIHNNFRNLLPPRVGRHEFETTIHPDRSRELEVTCEDFRSGQDFQFEGVIAPTSGSKPLVITVALTASNLRGERKEIFKVEKQIVSIEADELIDMSKLIFKRDYPVKRELERLLAAEEYSEIDWDDQDDN